MNHCTHSKNGKKWDSKLKKGEHATVCTKLWKCKSKKVESVDGKETEENNFFLAKAFLFKLDQVERIETKGKPQLMN